MGYYRHPVVAFQVTNMWRMDNDPPSRQIADFVKAWNASGRKPRLVMSTPSRFLARLRETAGQRITTVRRGDWQDWWSDGATTTPDLLAASQQAKRILADLPAAARLLGAGQAVDWLADYDGAWDDAIFFDEHTWGSYRSIAQPYHRCTIGGAAEKAVFACRAAERAGLACAAVLRGAKDYCDFSRTRRFRVLNPAAVARSGWVELSAPPIRFSCNAAREPATGKTYPLEDIREPAWSDAPPRSAPFDLPNDVWCWQVTSRRFFLADVGPGETRDFELVESHAPTTSPANGLTVRWDEKNGRIAALRTKNGVELVDRAAPHGLGQVVVETLKDRGQWQVLANRDSQLLQKQFRDEPVTLVAARTETTAYASSLVTVWQHPLLNRVEQRWDVLKSVPRAALTTTIWTREIAAPMALYLAFPLSLPGAKIVYGSAGRETTVGSDSMPGTCAEVLCHNGGLIFRGPSTAVLLATPDSPLGCPGGTMLRRRIVAPFTPANAHYYVNVANSYWYAQFPIMKAGKLVLRQWIEPADPKQASLAMLSDELWAYPIFAGCRTRLGGAQ